MFNLVYFLKSLIAVISPFAFNVLADSFGLDVQSYLFIYFSICPSCSMLIIFFFGLLCSQNNALSFNIFVSASMLVIHFYILYILKGITLKT